MGTLGRAGKLPNADTPPHHVSPELPTGVQHSLYVGTSPPSEAPLARSDEPRRNSPGGAFYLGALLRTTARAVRWPLNRLPLWSFPHWTACATLHLAGARQVWGKTPAAAVHQKNEARHSSGLELGPDRLTGGWGAIR